MRRRILKNNKTPFVTPTDYIDFNLPSGTLWARCNIGAANEYDYGDYYQWGATEVYPGTSSTNYYAEGTILDEAHDIATITKGKGWKTPNSTQISELFSNTNRAWTTISGKYGLKFTSKTNSSKYLFIPAAGRWYTNGLYFNNQRIIYWLSNGVSNTSPYHAYAYSPDHGTNVSIRSNVEKLMGCPIRPIYSKS